ncbi:MAG: type II toxin-antitoxin system VapC family toxin [Chloroflexi bacterium]|nr:type II toxin-antitoxin system VapC family toxin [Chloroflexota bacterium]
MKYLLDTNVVAELRKGARTNPNVRRWFGGLDSEAIALSVLTVGEITRGIENLRRRDPRSSRVLHRWLRRLTRDHGDRILPVDLAVAEEWGRLNVPDPVPVVDGLIAATAKVHGLTLATRNVKDVGKTGALLVNPFEA